jgi:porphobilinogen synthase
MARFDLVERPRRNRRSDALRRMVREHHLRPDDFIWPMFVVDGKEREPIGSMPGIDRLPVEQAVAAARRAYDLGIPAVALFPALDDAKKDPLAKESTNAKGLLQRTVKALKDAVPELLVITDVAMDPYSSDGHDGIVKDGIVVNDDTLEVLAAMAVSQAEAGADLVAPSDMMDGRIGAIRAALDESGFTDVGILAYSAKYASAFYGPFREALDSAPRHGDKKTYQMDPANVREAIREVLLDEEEGADIVMVKPGLAYLDVIRAVREVTELPLAAYNVSGEYAMVKAAAANGWIDGDAVMAEILLGFKRAGADVILSYAAIEVAERIG